MYKKDQDAKKKKVKKIENGEREACPQRY